MITDAMHTPTTIAPKAFFQSMPRRDATRAPVQAPVPGSGIPTKSTSPQNSYLLIRSLLLIAFFSSFSTSGRKRRVLRSYAKIGRAYTEGGEVTVLRDGYIDNCADGPDVDYYDRDELASLIGDRYDAKYPASSSKTADRSLGHKQEVSRNAAELLNDGKQVKETSSQEH